MRNVKLITSHVRQTMKYVGTTRIKGNLILTADGILTKVIGSFKTDYIADY